MRNARNLRNLAIVMVLALFVAFAPSGGNTADAVFTALTLGFLAGISWMLYTMSRERQLTLATLTDSRRAIFYGALGVIVFAIAGTDKLFASGGGTLLWILLVVGSVGAIWRVWSEANTY
jgi:hypothetical protein